jgi:hypothetical protein
MDGEEIVIVEPIDIPLLIRSLIFFALVCYYNYYYSNETIFGL